jgi:hypothetical protein
MISRDRLIQIGLVLLAGAALAAGGFLRGPVENRRQELKLVGVTGDPKIAASPAVTLLQVAPGGLKAIAINYLWIRSQQLKQEEKFYDAKQLRDLICDLMPNYAGVMSYHGWDMAWNISVARHTPEERWMWVNNGLTLLRDKGIQYNPDDLLMYKELAWVFFAKMADTMDDMHMVYKRRWAGLMQGLLGTPPTSGDVEEAIAAIAKIDNAPDSRAAYLAQEGVAEYVKLLDALEVDQEGEFLGFYNRFADDETVRPPGWVFVAPADDRQREIARLMTDPQYAQPRAATLAWARQEVLLHKYKMDVAWMVKLMRKYGPLDWRDPNAHALYWATWGLNKVQGVQLAEMNALNTDRIALGALKNMVMTGELGYVDNPQDPDDPQLSLAPDWRFVEPAHLEYVAAGAQLTGSADKLDDPANILADAHVVFLENAVQELYVGGREDLAAKYLDFIKTRLRPKDDRFKVGLDQFVQETLSRNGGIPMAEMSRVFWMNSLRRAYRSLLVGRVEDFTKARNFALKTYEKFVRGNPPERLRPPPFEDEETSLLVALMTQPQTLGLSAPLPMKAQLYANLPVSKRQTLRPRIEAQLRQECARAGKDFDQLFPVPSAKPPTE